jgi:hypothetical protein
MKQKESVCGTDEKWVRVGGVRRGWFESVCVWGRRFWVGWYLGFRCLGFRCLEFRCFSSPAVACSGRCMVKSSQKCERRCRV